MGDERDAVLSVVLFSRLPHLAREHFGCWGGGCVAPGHVGIVLQRLADHRDLSGVWSGTLN